MFGGTLLRNSGIITLCLFVFFIFSADITRAQDKDEQDILTRAQQLYKQGDYEGSIELLSKFIEKLRAMVEQKKSVAEAFYLLAKIYYEVGDDKKVEENLEKVFETYPAFEKEETNIGFKSRVDAIQSRLNTEKEPEVRKDSPKNKKESRVIQQPVPRKKKKKFPLLIVAGVVAVVAVLALVLGKKKKDDQIDIRGNWVVNEGYPDGSSGVQNITFRGNGLTGGTFTDHEGYTGFWSVNGSNVTFQYDNGVWFRYTGTLTSTNSMNGNWNWTYQGEPVSGTWSANRGGPGGTAQTFASGVKSFNKNVF